MGGALSSSNQSVVDFEFVPGYSTCKDPNQSKFVNWCGDGVPEAKKGLFHTHSSTVSHQLEGTPVVVDASTENLSRLLAGILYADLVLSFVLETIILVAPEEWEARVKHWDGGQEFVHGPVSAQRVISCKGSIERLSRTPIGVNRI
ncbi:hypothetical protein JB92DRAFT_2827005 [Gautieria morchelliformis]|nr:hypothetical protein JB92DRAFT_2827005 [Gautieria morchelliformis]